jgi:hypothetical protein
VVAIWLSMPVGSRTGVVVDMGSMWAARARKGRVRRRVVNMVGQFVG